MSPQRVTGQWEAYRTESSNQLREESAVARRLLDPQAMEMESAQSESIASVSRLSVSGVSRPAASAMLSVCIISRQSVSRCYPSVEWRAVGRRLPQPSAPRSISLGVPYA